MYKFRPGYYADVRIEDKFTTAIILVNGQPQQIIENPIKKAFIRVFDGKMWYYSSTTEIDEIQEELEGLYRKAQFNPNIDEHPMVKLYQVNVDRVDRFSDISVRKIDKVAKLQKLVETSKKLMGAENLAMTQSLYMDRNSLYEFYSSKGADIRYDFQTAGMQIFAMFSNGAENLQSGLSVLKNNYDEVILSDEKIKEFLDECVNCLNNAKPCEQGVFPVVLAPEVTGVFAHESFGHKSEADFMIGDETMAKEWVLGKQVGSSLLSIVDTGSIDGAGYVPYDDEGTKCNKTYLIKDGILTGRLHSSATASHLGENLTGNARALNCDFEPIVRMTSTYVDGGTSTKDELIAGIEKGYYIKDYKHGSGMSTFTIAPNIAYKIENGKITEPVKISVITGNVFETLGLIDGVANDLEVTSSVAGGCGKMEQGPLNVALGGPHIRVSKMNVQ